MNYVLFRCSEEGLHRLIVIAIFFPTHTLNKLVVHEFLLVFIDGMFSTYETAEIEALIGGSIRGIAHSRNSLE